MTGIDDAELDKLFWQCGPENDCDAFCAALNERLEAAEKMAVALEQIGGASLSFKPMCDQTIAAYRQSKECT